MNLSTTLSDGVTSRYTLTVGGKSYLFGPDNAHVTADKTIFTFNTIAGGIYTVTYSSVDAPVTNEAPDPDHAHTVHGHCGWRGLIVDVFNIPAG